MRRHLLPGAALVLVLAALAWSTAFRLGGGHWERVETPSMGTAAPVGTLLWVAPVDGRVETGEVVTFHKPGTGDGPVYSHRVTDVREDGSFTTAGDLSGPDAWVVQPGDVVGRVTHAVRGLGWLVLAAPVLVVGGLVTSGLALAVRRSARLPVGLLGASVTLAVVLVVHQPLTGAVLLGVEPEAGTAAATYVSTGLLPVEVSAPGGGSVVLDPGEAGTVQARAPEPGERAEVEVRAHLPWWFWLLVVGGCFVPSVGSVVVGGRAVDGGARRRVPVSIG